LRDKKVEVSDCDAAALESAAGSLSSVVEVGSVCMAEPAFSDLLRCEYSLTLASRGKPKLALVDDRNVLGMVLEVEGAHVLLTPVLARCSKAGKRLRTLVEKMAPSCERVHITRWELIHAIAEYYSIVLMHSLPHEPSSLFGYPPERAEGIRKVVEGLDISGRVLEVGCGYGMSTHALRSCGVEPFAIDNDASLVCEGLVRGALRPERTAVLDARWLSCCFEPREFDWVVGLMLGTIAPFTQPLWRTIILESVGMASEGVVFSVKEKEEVEFIRDVCVSAGLKGEVIDRRTDGLYDQWWYVGHPIQTFL